MARILYPALLTATLALAAALLLGPATANKLLSIVGVADAQAPANGYPGQPGGYGDPNQYPPGFNSGSNTSPGAPYDHLMTSAPTQPMAVAQPQNWAAGPGSSVANPGVRSVYIPPPGAPPAKPLASAQVIARVGPEVILAADLNPVYEIYMANKAAGAPAEEIASDYQELMSELKQMIDMKILYVDASNTIPAEGLKEFRKLVDEAFDKEQVKILMERLKVDSPAELDAKLRQQYGTSLDRRREMFWEQTLAGQWKKEHSTYTKEIDFVATSNYYREHKSEFEIPAQAQWEELTAQFADYNSRDDAYRAICDMGNDVVQRHIPFAEVAKKKSRGPTADKGGFRDWTTKGALVSKVLDEAIFSPNLPVGMMSQPIEDTDGFHIIRVIVRHDAGEESFLEAQKGIKKKITDERSKKMADEFMEKLRNQTQVWTIFDKPSAPNSSASPSPYAGQPAAPFSGNPATAAVPQSSFGR